MTDVAPGPIAVMKEIAIFEFAVKCLALLDPWGRRGKTKKPIRITRFGEPIAEIPASPAPASDCDRLDE
jgi:hypothetical protein